MSFKTFRYAASSQENTRRMMYYGECFLDEDNKVDDVLNDIFYGIR